MPGVVNISAAALQNKCIAWANTPAGKKRVKAVIEEARKGGRKLVLPNELMTEQKARSMARILIGMIRASLPESIASVGSTLSIASITDTGDGFKVEISFDHAALHRDSLTRTDGGPTYGGIDNIVALFNNGYNTGGKTVTGEWQTHGNVVVESVPVRPSLRFMNDAVSQFNSKYGSKYNVTATLSGEYTR